MNYHELYLQEKKRADLLEYDLDRVDEQHYDECEDLIVEIARLKLMIKRRSIN